MHVFIAEWLVLFDILIRVRVGSRNGLWNSLGAWIGSGLTVSACLLLMMMMMLLSCGRAQGSNPIYIL